MLSALRVASTSAAPRRAFATSAQCLGRWSKVKEKKGKTDMSKSKVYGLAHRDILVAARSGGSPDPALNITLANIVRKAKSDGVPKDVLERALGRARGDRSKGSQAVSYEAMAHGSVGVIVECLTDNLNRTTGFIREILTGHNARLAPVGFMFQRKGYVRISTAEPEDRVEQLLEEALVEAEDFDPVDGRDADGAQEIELHCPPQSLAALTGVVAASAVKAEVVASELIYSPLEPAADITDELREKAAALVESLEENEDCLRVWTTLD